MTSKQTIINIFLFVFVAFTSLINFYWYHNATQAYVTYEKNLTENLRKTLSQDVEFMDHILLSLDTRKSQSDENDKKQFAQTVFQSPYATILGDVDAPYTIVEFLDYNCGYCRRSFYNIKKILKEYTDVKIVVWELPLLGTGSRVAAQAVLASKKQGKYYDLHNAMLKSSQRIDEDNVFRIASEQGIDIRRLKSDMKSDEVKKSINLAYDIAEKLGIRGTPYFFVGDIIVAGHAEYSTMEEYIAQMKKDGCEYC